MPDPPRGGQRDDAVPLEHRIASLPRNADLRKTIAAEPPDNPFLLERWAEAGLVKERGKKEKRPAREPDWGVG